MFTNVRHEEILSLIRNYINSRRNSGQLCKKNQNNHDPQIEFRNFPNEKLTAEVAMNARVGQLVSIISVTDLDKEDRGQAVVTITEGNEAGHFAVDTVGEVHVVRVAGQLDWETASQYQLTVRAEDGGTPPRSSTATLTVNVGGKGRTASIFLYSMLC